MGKGDARKLQKGGGGKNDRVSENRKQATLTEGIPLKCKVPEEKKTNPGIL